MKLDEFLRSASSFAQFLTTRIFVFSLFSLFIFPWIPSQTLTVESLSEWIPNLNSIRENLAVIELTNLPVVGPAIIFFILLVASQIAYDGLRRLGALPKIGFELHSLSEFETKLRERIVTTLVDKGHPEPSEIYLKQVEMTLTRITGLQLKIENQWRSRIESSRDFFQIFLALLVLATISFIFGKERIFDYYGRSASDFFLILLVFLFFYSLFRWSQNETAAHRSLAESFSELASQVALVHVLKPEELEKLKDDMEQQKLECVWKPAVLGYFLDGLFLQRFKQLLLNKKDKP